MGRKRKYTARFKAKVAFEAAKGEKTISHIASQYGIHPQQVRAWKRDFLNNMYLVFEKEHQTKELEKERRLSRKVCLYPSENLSSNKA